MSAFTQSDMQEQTPEPVIDFDHLDPIAFEATLAFLRANPEPPKELTDYYQGLVEDAVAEYDWMDPGNPLDLHPMASAKEPATPSDILKQQWVPNMLCWWDGCTSKAKFPTFAKFRLHLENIHTKPLLCEIPRCAHKKPFSSKADLQRHVATIHQRGARPFICPFICPFPSCDAELKSFARKDKLWKHIRETEHLGDMYCVFPHCVEHLPLRFPGFKTRQQISAHYSKKHSAYIETNKASQNVPYRCALGLCALSLTQEHWSWHDMTTHIQECHGVDDICAIAFRPQLEGGIYILRPEHLQKFGDHKWQRDIEWQECNVCSQQQETIESIQAFTETTAGFQQSNSYTESRYATSQAILETLD